MNVRSVPLVLALIVAGCSGPAQQVRGEEEDLTPDLSSVQARPAPIASAEALDAKCSAHDDAACAELGRRQVDSEEAAAAKRGLDLLEATCTRGEPTACFYLGNVWRDGAAVDRDPKRAAKRYDEGCKRGSGPACHELALLVSGEDLGTPDPSRGAELDARACELEPRLCLHIGFRYQYALGVSEDLAAAARHYDAACDAGDNVGCHRLAEQLAAGAGVRRDTRRALTLFERSCQRGTSASCANLGLVYLQGDLGVTAEPKRGVSLLDRACNLGNAVGCANLGVATEQGLGGLRADPAHAARLYEKSCADDALNGCTFLGIMLVQGKGTKKDAARANELFSKACDGGYGPGCTWLGASYVDGIGVAADRRRARALFQRACDLGERAACDALR